MRECVDVNASLSSRRDRRSLIGIHRTLPTYFISVRSIPFIYTAPRAAREDRHLFSFEQSCPARGDSHCSARCEPGNQLILVISFPVLFLIVEPLSSEHRRPGLLCIAGSAALGWRAVIASPSLKTSPRRYHPNCLCHPFSRG